MIFTVNSRLAKARYWDCTLKKNKKEKESAARIIKYHLESNSVSSLLGIHPKGIIEDVNIYRGAHYGITTNREK